MTYDRRLCQRVINRLNEPGDGDIIVPQRQNDHGWKRRPLQETTNLDYIPVMEDQVKLMFERGCELIPAIADTNERGAFMATRPLLDLWCGKGRSLARTFKCFDHKESFKIWKVYAITGGKATTMRLMAENSRSCLPETLYFSSSCETRESPLLSYREYLTIPDEVI
ncbi:MAG: hypothetical protein MZV70_46400 [Desulfobacterales bacterium]|nr:hypothetical protein [Desulfobacterales bacterium]